MQSAVTDLFSNADAAAPTKRFARARQSFTIALTAFLTVADLFGVQAIIPRLTERYEVMPAHMAVAVNASTIGMAIASLLIALFNQGIDRRKGILLSLVLLSVPTALLAHADSLFAFACLRVTQGLLMASAFSLTLAYLGESLTAADAAHAFAAYITGNVASNLFGRLLTAYLADKLGIGQTFYCLASLNIAGALLVYFTVERTPAMPRDTMPVAASPSQRLALHLANPDLRAVFAIGFLILFAFIGTFSFVNFVLVAPPISIGQMQIGLVYFVFLPSIVTTLLAGRVVERLKVQRSLRIGFAVAGCGLPLLLLPSLYAVLTGMALVAVGTFFAQAVTTGFVSQAAKSDRGAASGLYLASYFFGGITGAAVLGAIFDAFGWTACVAGIAIAMIFAALLAGTLHKQAIANVEN